MPKSETKRTYHSEARKAQAQKTRARILKSAKKLISTRGFDNVTIDHIAQDAEVSAPTIYALFQSKTGILRVIMDEALSPEQHSDLVMRGKQQPTAEKRLETAAIIARQLYDAEQKQLGSLQSAAILGPELKKLEIEREERRYHRLEEGLLKLGSEGALAAGLDATQALDILWAFTGRDLYRMLVVERDWSSDAYEEWLKELLVKTLLK